MESVLLIGLAAIALVGLLSMSRERFDPKLFDPLDTDKNEVLSRAEFEAAKSAAEEENKTEEGTTSDTTGDTTGDTTTEDSGIDTPMEPRTEFEIGLELYKKNMLAYKTTGDSASKAAADEAKKWIDGYLKSVGDNINTDTTYIKQFVKDYKDTNPELLKMQETIRNVRTKGPQLQDTYETEKKATYVEPYDVQQFYTKLGIFGAVLAIIAVVALF